MLKWGGGGAPDFQGPRNRITPVSHGQPAGEGGESGLQDEDPTHGVGILRIFFLSE